MALILWGWMVFVTLGQFNYLAYRHLKMTEVPKKRWYIVQRFQAMKNKCKTCLNISNAQYGRMFGEFWFQTRVEVEIRAGQRPK